MLKETLARIKGVLRRKPVCVCVSNRSSGMVLVERAGALGANVVTANRLAVNQITIDRIALPDIPKNADREANTPV